MLVPFGVSLVVFTFLLVMAKVIELTELVLTRGVGLGVVGRLLGYGLPYFLVFTIPMATLLGVLLGLLRLSADNEILAMRAAGIRLSVLLRPVGILSGTSAVVCFVLAMWVMPWGNHMFEVQIYQILKGHAALAIRERVFVDSIPGMVIYVNRVEPGGRLGGVFIVDERQPGRRYSVVARKGRIIQGKNRVLIRLYEGTITAVDKALKTARAVEFGTYDIAVKLAQSPGRPPGKRHEKEMYASELLAAMAKAGPGTRRYYLLQMELLKKFTVPLGCLVMGLLGIPLGVQLRGGRWGGVILALGVFMAYYLMLSAAWSFGEDGSYPPIIGMWVPDIVLGAIGWWLLRRTLREQGLPLSGVVERLAEVVGRRK